jgi:Leucine-rich repeat (LRR) protein
MNKHLHRSFSPRPLTVAVTASGLAALGVLLGACSGDVINMGEDDSRPDLPATSRCRASAEVGGDVTVHDQAELATLEGCETIDGALYILPFEGADLQPLYALKAVTGPLSLGSDASDPAASTPEGDPPSAWLGSLAGLEGLESTGSLWVRGLMATNVDPLEHLRVVELRASVALTDCPNLVDVAGLKNATGIRELDLDCPELTSIAPLQLPQVMDSLYIKGAKLADLGQQQVFTLLNLSVSGTAVENLDAFSQLGQAYMSVDINGNPALTNMDGLNRLSYIGALNVGNNDALEHLPELSSLSLVDTMSVMGNDRLQEVDLPQYARASTGEPPFSFSGGPRQVSIWNNAELRRIRVPGWAGGGGLIDIQRNDKMQNLDLSDLVTISRLTLRKNPILDTVEIGNLANIGNLEVIENPLLNPSVFDTVATFYVTMSDNAAAP